MIVSMCLYCMCKNVSSESIFSANPKLSVLSDIHVFIFSIESTLLKIKHCKSNEQLLPHYNTMFILLCKEAVGKVIFI